MPAYDASIAFASNIPWFCVYTFGSVILIAGGIMNKKHHTDGSLDKYNDLTCYTCDSMLAGEACTNLSAVFNTTIFHRKCQGENKICMVKRYSYTVSNENSTSTLKLWSLKRSCAHKCEQGCIIIGERTKLHACTSCCSTNLCNTLNNAPTTTTTVYGWFFLSYAALAFLILSMAGII